MHNAITHGGGDIDVAVRCDERWVRISVADGGPGFTEAALDHATERFWRGDSARSRSGTGLGLSIASVLAEAHGGSLLLENGTRGGAVVTLLLPRAPGPVLTAT
jgi:two-component system sensor histidine kinase MtrB